MTGPVVIVEEGLRTGTGAPSGLHTIPRRRRPWWRRGTSWAPLDPSEVTDALSRVPAPAVVLARSAAADPGAACLGPLARLLGHRVVQLPSDPGEAAWSASIAASLLVLPDEAFLRVVDVLCCGPATSPPAPRCLWGGGISVPALRPETLARWASCAWRRCGWCRRGGLPGRACRTCGTAIADEAVAP